MRNFVLRDKDGNEHGIFTGKQPRQAALKAANKGNGIYISTPKQK